MMIGSVSLKSVPLRWDLSFFIELAILGVALEPYRGDLLFRQYER